ncbi:putative Heat shock protein [Candidatus Terasakiella magnetica]|uniref:Putative Heat shock protein n=1 Tax=Candidatus Terasakiella magnetica TaxID=1867952 RepID=A0A1C3RIL2_9PROT|nr:RNA-binding S4 domain-containing protein [Candidatus Terasakiella magnetica]SCA57099.1 putative Heat shock protein [Candidatus Terasakiella magnetica]
MTKEAPATLRVDKWLWHTRFFKSRTLAGKFVSSGKLRLNGNLISKAHVMLKPEDVLTFPLGPNIRLIRVIAMGTRRGPAPEARTLYEDLDPPQPKPKKPKEAKVAEREPGTGRPTKRERRTMDKWLADAE